MTVSWKAKETFFPKIEYEKSLLTTWKLWVGSLLHSYVQ